MAVNPGTIGEKWVPKMAKLAPKFKKILDGKGDHTHARAAIGRGLIQLLRTMRFVFGMHGQPCMISEIRTPG